MLAYRQSIYILATRGQNNNHFWPPINFGHYFGHVRRKSLCILVTRNTWPKSWRRPKVQSQIILKNYDCQGPVKMRSGISFGFIDVSCRQYSTYLLHFATVSIIVACPELWPRKINKMFASMNTFWPRMAKMILVFGHALILDAILATRGQNHYAFWPRLNFGHPCILATHTLILAAHA